MLNISYIHILSYNIIDIIINIIDYENDMIIIITLNNYKFSYNNDDNNNEHYC